MKTPNSTPAVQDRRLRIELLRMRASYERMAIGQSACRVADDLHPRALLAGLRDRWGAGRLSWLDTGARALRRYPVLFSLLSSVVFNPRRRRIALKIALISGLVWLGKRASPTGR